MIRSEKRDRVQTGDYILIGRAYGGFFSMATPTPDESKALAPRHSRWPAIATTNARR